MRRVVGAVAVGSTAVLALAGLAMTGVSPAAAEAPGDPQWQQIFSGYSYASPEKVLVSDARVYVGGTQETDEYNDLDYVVHTYSRQGLPGWSRTYAGGYDPPSADADVLVDMALSGSGRRVVVTGTSEGRRTASDIATVAYRSDGSRLWVARYDGSAHGADVARSVTVASDGTVYVAGRSRGGSGTAVTTIAYDASGSRLWARHYDAGRRWNGACSVLTSPDARRILVVGSTRTTAGARDVSVVTYRRDGRVVWQRRLDAPGTQRPAVAALAPNDPRLYIAGTSDGNYLTEALGRRGSPVWHRTYDGSEHGVDTASDAVISPDGKRLYVTGTSDEASSAVTTIAYARDGVPQWTAHYDAGTDDAGGAIAVSPDGDTVYVEVSETRSFATVAYTSAGTRLWTSTTEVWDAADWRDVAASPDGSFVIAIGAVQDVYWKAAVTSLATE